MPIRHLALVSEATGLGLGELARVSAALQKQLAADFGPTWDVQATIDVFEKLTDVPPAGYWPLVVRDDIGINDLGAHHDALGRPFALVLHSDDWPLTASHEALEMLADPFSTTFFPGPAPDAGQGPVEYLLEVCDPCGAAEFGYEVNGLFLSDFVTPHYFDAFEAPGVRYSFRGNVSAPRQVLKGGYLSWRDPASGEWSQLRVAGNRREIRALGLHPVLADISLRGAIDRASGVHPARKGLPAAKRARVRAARQGHDEAARARAAGWRACIDRLTEK